MGTKRDLINANNEPYSQDKPGHEPTKDGGTETLDHLVMSVRFQTVGKVEIRNSKR